MVRVALHLDSCAHMRGSTPPPRRQGKGNQAAYMPLPCPGDIANTPRPVYGCIDHPMQLPFIPLSVLCWSQPRPVMPLLNQACLRTIEVPCKMAQWHGVCLNAPLATPGFRPRWTLESAVKIRPSGNNHSSRRKKEGLKSKVPGLFTHWCLSMNWALRHDHWGHTGPCFSPLPFSCCPNRVHMGYLWATLSGVYRFACSCGFLRKEVCEISCPTYLP